MLAQHQLEAENERLRERVQQLEKVLGVSGRTVPKAFCFTRMEASIFGMLLSREIVSADQMLSALYAGQVWPDSNIVNVYISKIRKKLAPYSLVIRNRWGVGYWLSAEDKERVAEMVRAERGEA